MTAMRWSGGWTLLLGGILLLGAPRTGGGAEAAPPSSIDKWLSQNVLPPGQAQADVLAHTEARVPRLAVPVTRDAWETQAEQIRREMLERVVFRGIPASWREGKPQVEWIEDAPGGPGYRLRRLKYEALPGLWVPALLYEPTELTGPLAVSLHVNGHDGAGKAAPYKQIRCINLARRGVLALNVEWLGMGQLRVPGNAHGRLNQLDLCGVSGVGVFFLVMQRGLDVVLQHPQADPRRVAVAGLSGGGWQTIFLSALDRRVTASNPVAGYSSFLTRTRYHSDLGDSEQTPCDMATVADYTHLTALRAPRGTLLTYNVKDDCCFASGHALPPLVAAARPAYQLWGATDQLQEHVNQDPGTHNFERDNRQALYRFLAAQGFAAPGREFPVEEFPSEPLVRTAEQLQVPLPAENLDLHRLALNASRGLPRSAPWPATTEGVDQWRAERLAQLRETTRFPQVSLQAQLLEESRQEDLVVRHWRLRIGDQWTVPATELEPAGKSPVTGTWLVVSQRGRRTLTPQITNWIGQGRRVLAIDPLFWGESEVKERAYLHQLLVTTVGSRPVGLQAAQLAAAARWLQERQLSPVHLAALGPRACLAALVTSALEPAVAAAELHEGLGSLHEVLEQDLSYEQAPELFCFGLLEHFDISGLTALVAPRPMTLVDPSPRAREALTPVAEWYKRLGSSHRPVE
ncbi:MAG: hypothetical protein U0935_24030 [Pirellulales bacterium]